MSPSRVPEDARATSSMEAKANAKNKIPRHGFLVYVLRETSSRCHTGWSGPRAEVNLGPSLHAALIVDDRKEKVVG